MAKYVNTLSHGIRPIGEDGELLRFRSGETYEATGELEKQVNAMPGQEPVKQKKSKGKGKGGSENPPADAGDEATPDDAEGDGEAGGETPPAEDGNDDQAGDQGDAD